MSPQQALRQSQMPVKQPAVRSLVVIVAHESLLEERLPTFRLSLNLDLFVFCKSNVGNNGKE